MPIPRFYLGTMTFGWSQASSAVDEVVACEMLRQFGAACLEAGQKAHIDTARIYAGGKTEQILGAAVRNLQSSAPEVAAILAIGSKAHPSQTFGLSPKGIRNQLQLSLDTIGVNSFEEYFLHQPDPKNSLLDSLRTLNELHEEGVVRHIGMSNYSSSEMQRAFELCEEHSLEKPTLYQGIYNPLNRMIENELLPLLRKHECSFVAYNPLAAGLLAGKHEKGGQIKSGRFKNNQNYLPRFYTDKNFEALDRIRDSCTSCGVDMIDATYRWILRHSTLTEADGVLLGASSNDQLKSNLSACNEAQFLGDLPDPLLASLDEAWTVTRDGAFPYWRSYSLDMPDQINRDHGASYSAKTVDYIMQRTFIPTTRATPPWMSYHVRQQERPTGEVLRFGALPLLLNFANCRSQSYTIKASTDCFSHWHL